MLLQLWITGTIDIKWLIVTGNLFMFGTAYLFYKTLKAEQLSWYYFIPVPYILFNLVYSENAFWGIAAIQNTPVIFWALLAVYGLGRDNRAGWYIGFFSAIIATFTSGNGMLTWIVGVVFLLYQKNFRFLVIWILAAAAVLSFYFLFEYQLVPPPPESALSSPLYNALLFFGFLGNALYLDIPHPLVPGFYKDMLACALMGMFIGMVALLWLVRFIFSRNPKWSYWFLLGAIMFLMGTGAMFVLSRPVFSYFMYGGDIFSRRYLIFGVVLLAATYVCALILIKRSLMISRIIAGTFFAVFLCLNFLSYYNSTATLRKLHAALELDGYFWTNYHAFLTQGNEFYDVPFWNHPTRMKNLMSNIENTGISKPFVPEELASRNLIIPASKKGNLFKGKLDIGISYRVGGYNQKFKFLTFKIIPTSSADLKYVILKGKERIIVLPLVPVPYDWQETFAKNTYYSGEYQSEIFRRKLPVDDYEIWVMSKPVSGISSTTLFTGKVLSLK
ncbi:hypothetical protein DYBT9275_03644 [Dyadobacter sp. CECT 9275]|uniref:Uncharacterized protein n=1 Tax=Dyadobacter helix TaxID=2822344 RepID=A0A916JDV3_9BACT|nr:hypothetical protein [Dyadobacter sp. CECT 9275]CAG5005755.1 hypothetical protein DYBT9275_03644 [Dyadobacter sp. CECT 9275]